MMTTPIIIDIPAEGDSCNGCTHAHLSYGITTCMIFGRLAGPGRRHLSCREAQTRFVNEAVRKPWGGR